MAFGNYNNNNQSSRGDRSPSVYGSYNWSNKDSTVDKTRLSSRFWNNSLVLSISPRNPDSPEDRPTFDAKNGISIYLNHTKARLFAMILREFIQDPDRFDNSGVYAGSALIVVSTGKEFNSASPLIIIRRVDEKGTIVSSFAYEIRQQNMNACTIHGFNEKEPTAFDRRFYPDLELEQLAVLMEEYAKSETRAIAYTVVDALNYEVTNIHGKLNRIGEKLGLDMSYASRGSGASGSNGSFFNRGGGSSSSTSSGSDEDLGGPQYTSATLDDFE